MVVAVNGGTTAAGQKSIQKQAAIRRLARSGPNPVGVQSTRFEEEDGGGGHWRRGSGRPESPRKVGPELVQTQILGELARLTDGNSIIGLINRHMEMKEGYELSLTVLVSRLTEV